MFDLSFVISLPKRYERYKNFMTGYPYPVRRFDALDGEAVMPPDWWKAGNGAWGCYRSHLSCIEQGMNENVGTLAIFEDDCEFVPDFSERLQSFLQHVPQDWDMLYLGGQLLYASDFPPQRINNYVYRPFEVHRTHAYVIRDKFFHTIYRHLLAPNWMAWEHIDHHYGKLCRTGQYRIYCPHRWLANQSCSYSDIRQIEWKPDMPDPYTFDPGYKTVILYFSTQPSKLLKLIQILDPTVVVHEKQPESNLEVPRLISIDGSLEDVDTRRLNPNYLEIDSQEMAKPDSLVLRLAKYMNVKNHLAIADALRYAKENTRPH